MRQSPDKRVPHLGRTIVCTVCVLAMIPVVLWLCKAGYWSGDPFRRLPVVKPVLLYLPWDYSSKGGIRLSDPSRGIDRQIVLEGMQQANFAPNMLAFTPNGFDVAIQPASSDHNLSILEYICVPVQRIITLRVHGIVAGEVGNWGVARLSATSRSVLVVVSYNRANGAPVRQRVYKVNPKTGSAQLIPDAADAQGHCNSPTYYFVDAHAHLWVQHEGVQRVLLGSVPSNGELLKWDCDPAHGTVVVNMHRTVSVYTGSGRRDWTGSGALASPLMAVPTRPLAVGLAVGEDGTVWAPAVVNHDLALSPAYYLVDCTVTGKPMARCTVPGGFIPSWFQPITSKEASFLLSFMKVSTNLVAMPYSTKT